MTAPEAVQIILAIATLVGSVAGAILAVRNGQKTSAVHELVNGASAQLNALREAQGFRAGVEASSVPGPQNPVRSAEPGRTVPPTGK